MHPVIRIASFLVIAISLAHLSLNETLTAATILLLLFFVNPSYIRLQQAIRLVIRLRWLFISIFIIYAWFTPGTLMLPQWGAFSPYIEGMLDGTLRIASLVILLLSLSLLVLGQQQDELVNAVYWYCRPLKLVGISPHRVLARLVLTIEAVKKISTLWDSTAVKDDKIQSGYQRVLQLVNRVTEVAETESLTILSIKLQANPAWYQWFIPLSLALLFWYV